MAFAIACSRSPSSILRCVFLPATKEREIRTRLEPLYRIAKALLPTLDISHQNRLNYASLANCYTVHDLRNLKADQTHLYLLCYAWQGHSQITDNRSMRWPTT